MLYFSFAKAVNYGINLCKLLYWYDESKSINCNIAVMKSINCYALFLISKSCQLWNQPLNLIHPFFSSGSLHQWNEGCRILQQRHRLVSPKFPWRFFVRVLQCLKLIWNWEIYLLVSNNYDNQDYVSVSYIIRRYTPVGL